MTNLMIAWSVAHARVADVGTRERRVDAGAARGRALTATVLAELRSARLDRGLGGADIARSIGISQSQYSRIERGLTDGLTIQQAAVLLSAVGLDLSVRCYPGGQPLRDAASIALMGRFMAEIHRSLRVLTEVPFPESGDRRAWDIVVVGRGWRHGAEAETRPRDRQALERRLALKLRDGDVSSMSLVLLDSRHNRDFVRSNAAAFEERFPIPGRRALEALRAGVDPGGNSIILL
jgi:transcriptional regulator with XRE-family HTH domain